MPTTTGQLTIRQVLLNTKRNFESRFDNYFRDILPSRIKIVNKKIYKKDRLDMYDEKLEIISFSAPQYKPYTNHLKNPLSKQRKYKHSYDIVIQLAKDDKGEFSLDSKISWRVGSYKMPTEVPQSKTKTIHRATRDRLVKKVNSKNISDKEKKALLKKELDMIRKKGKYLCDGDYMAQELGINLDNYYRNFFVQYKFNCLYGPLSKAKPHEDVDMPFFCKHTLGVLFYLTSKRVIKT